MRVSLKHINYLNLIAGIILLWTCVRSPGIYYDYYLIVGYGLTIWYNWETYKQLHGQKTGLNKVNYVVGIMTVVFGVLLVLSGSAIVTKAILSDINGAIFLGTIRIVFGVLVVILTLATLKFYRTGNVREQTPGSN